MLYLTPTMPQSVVPPAASNQLMIHATWSEVAPLIDDIWSSSTVDGERIITSYLLDLIRQIESRAPATVAPVPRPATDSVKPPDPTLAPSRRDDVEAALELAALTEADGMQRALDSDIADPADLDALRLTVRDILREGPKIKGTTVQHVRPWLWRTATSGGRALTAGGTATGYELRLSRDRV